jgi:hypothetical protein
MLKFHRVVTLVTLVVFLPALSLTGGAETLRFAWPDGASAKVHVRSDGRQVEKGVESAWGMSCDFTMRVQQSGDRVVVSRNDFSGWKGTLPPSFGGGAERYTDMIPTFIVSGDGSFLGIEGHEMARKLINSSVEQSGGLGPLERKAFEEMLSNATLEAIATDHWSTLVALWRDVELNPAAGYELRNVASVPVLGGEVEIIGTVRFVEETPCASGGGNRRCVHFHAETGADKAQVSKLLQSALRQLGASRPVVTAWDQRFKVDIVMDMATMLPQQLTTSRSLSMNLSVGGQSGSTSEETTKVYTFAWTLPDDGRKK